MSAAGPPRGANSAPRGAAQRPHLPTEPQAWGDHATVHASQLGALGDALAAVLTFAEPADAVLRKFFRLHPKMGMRDRAYVAEGVFATLRRLRSLTRQADSSTPRHLAIAVTLREMGLSLRELEPLLDADEVAWARIFKSRKPVLSEAESAELPDWLWDKLGEALPAHERDVLV